jgi:hypothetical protein
MLVSYVQFVSMFIYWWLEAPDNAYAINNIEGVSCVPNCSCLLSNWKMFFKKPYKEECILNEQDASYVLLNFISGVLIHIRQSSQIDI